jgi:hypothetical protein
MLVYIVGNGGVIVKRNKIIVLLAVFLFYGATAAYAAPDSVEKEKNIFDLSESYIESTGMAVAPKGKQGAQGRALARRGAIVDLQRNLLEYLKGVQIDARTTMDDFMADDRVRSEISGAIKNVELLKGEWDGEAFMVTGRLKLDQIREIVIKYKK